MKSDPPFNLLLLFSDLTVLATRTRGRNYNTILHIYFEAVRREKSNIFVCKMNVRKSFYEKFLIFIVKKQLILS